MLLQLVLMSLAGTAVPTGSLRKWRGEWEAPAGLAILEIIARTHEEAAAPAFKAGNQPCIAKV